MTTRCLPGQDSASSSLPASCQRRRNVLVITVGLAPSVVTRTVYALLERTPPRTPQEIHLITTARGAAHWLDPTRNADKELRRIFRQFRIEPVRPKVLVPETANGEPIPDVRTIEQSVAYALALNRLIEEIKSRPGSDLHVSMAGGRRTMSGYCQTAMSFLADRDDELTRAVVEPEALAENPAFFWPGQLQQEIELSSSPSTASQTAVASNAKIVLATIPFLPLRQRLSHNAFARDNSDRWNIAGPPPNRCDVSPLKLLVAERTLVVGGHSVKFCNQEFALYRLLVAAIEECWSVANVHEAGWILVQDFLDPESRPFRAFFDFYRDCFDGTPNEAYWRFKCDIERHLSMREAAAGRDYVANRFKTLRNKIKQRIEKSLPGCLPSLHVVPQSRVVKPKGRIYGLALRRHEIAIIRQPPMGEAKSLT